MKSNGMARTEAAATVATTRALRRLGFGLIEKMNSGGVFGLSRVYIKGGGGNQKAATFYILRVMKTAARTARSL